MAIAVLGLACSHKAGPPAMDASVTSTDAVADRPDSSDSGASDSGVLDQAPDRPDAVMDAPAPFDAPAETIPCAATIGTRCFAGGSCCSGLTCLAVGPDPATCCVPIGGACAMQSDCCGNGLTCVDGKCCGTSFLLCGPNDCCASIGYYCNPGRYCSLRPDAASPG
jgi:hypothetical protein